MTDHDKIRLVKENVGFSAQNCRVLSIIVWVGRLIYEHTLNVFDAAQADGDHDHVTPTAPGADHHHGILDVHDQCCALHTLAGPLPGVADVALANLSLSVRIAPAALVALADTYPGRLDRPPKPMPLI